MSLDIVDIRATSTRLCKNATTLHISKNCLGRLVIKFVVALEIVTCRNGSALCEPPKLKWFRKQRMSTVQYILRINILCLQGRLNKVFYII